MTVSGNIPAKNTVSEILSRFCRNVKELFLLMLPHGRMEKTVLFFSLLVYLPLAFYLGINTSFILNPEIYVDIYFSFDVTAYIKNFMPIVPTLADPRHPFLMLVNWPIALLGRLSLFSGVDVRFYILLTAMSVMVACANVYVYRYLHDVVRIGIKRSLLLTTFFLFFATNITLSFTPESFSFSLFFLTFMMMNFSLNIRNGKNISFFQLFVLGNIIGGITITNIVKCFIPDLFSGMKITRILKRALIVSLFFLSAYIGTLLIGSSNIKESVTSYRDFVASDSNKEAYQTSKGNALFSYFLNAPVYWGNFTNAPIGKYNNPQLNITYCSHFPDYILGGTLLLLCLFSAITNRKNKLVFILLLSFFVDFFITFVMNFGLFESFLYGGHWVFVIPMLLGWGYDQLKMKTGKRVFDVIMVLMLVTLVIHNAYKTYQIVDFALKYYPA